MKDHLDSEAVQTQIPSSGEFGGKSLLTVIFPKSELMLSFLCNCHTAADVRCWFNHLFEAFAPSGAVIFNVIITKNASEFFKTLALKTTLDGMQRAHVFYWYPDKNLKWNAITSLSGISTQRIFFYLHQKKVGLMMSHINSNIKLSLGNRIPFDVCTDKHALIAWCV